MKISVGGIISIFLTVVVGAVLLTAIADRGSVVTSDIDITNETLDISAGFNDTDFNTSMLFNLSNNNWVTATVQVMNGTDDMVEGTDFSVNYVTEAINFSNTSGVWNMSEDYNNNSRVDYSYFHDDYISSSTSRTLMGLIPLFFVIGILLFVIARLKESEILTGFKK
jgi:hypothetical protein